ncbi:hypothetical protein JT241_05310 [Helicobacter pylori]|nr:hypothetical protein [Helicobacter pylori]
MYKNAWEQSAIFLKNKNAQKRFLRRFLGLQGGTIDRMHKLNTKKLVMSQAEFPVMRSCGC